MHSRVNDPAVAGLLAAGRWDDALVRAARSGADSVGAIVAAWHSGSPAEAVLERARRLAAMRPDLIEALELLAWLESAAGNVETARELAAAHAEVSPRLQALGVAIELASGAPSGHGDHLPRAAGELRGAFEVMSLVESGDNASAKKRAEAATREPDAPWLAWLARSVAEARGDDARAALESAFVALQAQPRTAEARNALRLVARRRFTLPRSAACFLFGIALFAGGAAQDGRATGVMSVAFATVAVLAAAAGGAMLFIFRRRLAALTPELRAALGDVLAFRYRETLMPAALAFVPLAALIPGRDQPFLLSLATAAATALATWVWRVYHARVLLRPLLAFALTGLQLDVRTRPQRWWQRRWHQT